ncbi:hypothetical protein Lnau_3105 [Legionella nautarum]|uniref:Uncharacterized protein n=1 Tax=Legionella nautarum TaxID=45070 RepID=A0A0W0WIP7_9GAMM|nr:hypothetical protein [Legionella nautarum]KTD32194.1 hypothetical protein Lnau_3105 [Legionella nautarum]
MTENRRYKRLYTVLLTLGLGLSSNLVFADDIDPFNKASDWLSNILISLSLSILAPVIMFNLWQFYQGHKDAREVVKPILITALIVGTPAVVLLIKQVLQ